MKTFGRLLSNVWSFLEDTPSQVRVIDPNAPVDVLAIDVSGSMNSNDYAPTRLEGAKESARRFIEKRAVIEPNALVGVVTFSRWAHVVSRPIPAMANLSQLWEAVDSISTSGATNISSGLRRAFEKIQETGSSGYRRVVLLTDGHATHGDNPIATANQIKSAGIQLDITGIGGSPSEVNERELKEMASVVNGELRYWFIKSVGELARKFEALALREIG